MGQFFRSLCRLSSHAKRGVQRDVESSQRLLLLQIRNKSSSFCLQAINRRRSRNIESAVVFVAPGKIGRLFGHRDGPQMMALRIPYPNTLGSSYENVAVLVDLDTIRHTVFRTS